jgi:hypothetical protein
VEGMGHSQTYSPANILASLQGDPQAGSLRHYLCSRYGINFLRPPFMDPSGDHSQRHTPWRRRALQSSGTRRAWMAEAKALAFNVSVPSVVLQGRSRLEKPLHKWLDGIEKRGRGASMCRGAPEAWASRRWRSSLLRERQSEVAGGCGWCSGYRLRAWSRTTWGCSTRCLARAPGGRRSKPLRRCVGGFKSCCVAGGPRRPARAGR